MFFAATAGTNQNIISFKPLGIFDLNFLFYSLDIIKIKGVGK